MADKQGYKVEVIVNCYDAKGDRISQTDADWFGFDNTTANLAVTSLIDGVQAVVAQWESVKLGGGRDQDRGGSVR